MKAVKALSASALSVLFLLAPSAFATTCTYDCVVSFDEIRFRISGSANSYEVEAMKLDCRNMGWTWSLEGGYGYDIQWWCHKHLSEQFVSQGQGATIPEAARAARESCTADGKAVLAARLTNSTYDRISPTHLACTQ